jgi:hypothetical protein
MSDETKSSDANTEQWSAFQRMWTDTFTRMIQLGMTYSPESAPPEMIRQIRTGIFQALAQSWDEFLRSPQFAAAMKQWMDNAVAFRSMSNEFLTKAHHESQGLAREDLDTLMLTVRHMENRILDRLEAVGTHVKQLQQRLDSLSPNPQPIAEQPRKSRST